MSKPLVKKVVPAGAPGSAGYAQGRRSAQGRAPDEEPGELRDRFAARYRADEEQHEEPDAGASSSGSDDADPRAAARAEGDARGRFAGSPTQLPKAGWKDVLIRTAKEVKADNVPITAAGVAFYGMLALVPTMVALVSIYGLVISPAESAKQVEGLTRALPGEAARLLVDQLKSITGANSSGLGIKLAVSLIGLLWSASSGTTALIRGLGIAYDQPEGRGFVKLRSRALLLTVVAILGAALVLGLTVALPAIFDAAGFSSLSKTIGLVVRWPLLGLLSLAGLAALYRYGPDRDQAKWRWASPGALLAALLWVVGTGLFALYAGRFGTYNQTYGTLAGAVVLLLWLYLTSLAVLIGAELNAELERDGRFRPGTRPTRSLTCHHATSPERRGVRSVPWRSARCDRRVDATPSGRAGWRGRA